MQEKDKQTNAGRRRNAGAVCSVCFILDEIWKWTDEERGEGVEKGFEIRKKVVERKPDDVGVLHALSFAYLRMGEYLSNDAWEEFEDAQDEFYDAQEGIDDDAKEEYEGEPDYAQARNYYTKALETLNKAFDRAPVDSEAFNA